MLTFLYTLMSMVIGIMITTIFYLYSDNKNLKKYIKKCEEDYKILLEDSRQIVKRVRELEAKKEPEQEHELQGEFEADDDTYNKIIQEWIYGAEAEEEGGIDG